MKTANIILGLLAGAAVGGIVAIILKAEHELLELNGDGEESSFDKIAQQFSDKFSSEFKTAESKIKSTVKSNEFSKHDEEGVFL